MLGRSARSQISGTITSVVNGQTTGPGEIEIPGTVTIQQDGAVLPAPRLVVPADRRAGRNVRELVAIEIR